jgi:hypothetical protein
VEARDVPVPFAADGIHLSDAGDRRAAAWQRECLEVSATVRALLSAPSERGALQAQPAGAKLRAHDEG